MYIEYYKDDDLAYANRKRFTRFNFRPFFSEEQKAVLLGDGARTQIKTSVDNICDYVKIDGTRWYVTSYIHLNGKQVQLNLQRDVIGEFGLADSFGKIERGYTDSVLKNKKELSLNQILKKRFPLKSTYDNYGNYRVSTHDNECWGIMYFVKPSGLNPGTGDKNDNTLNINIPAFSPKLTDATIVPEATSIYTEMKSDCFIRFAIDVHCFRDGEILKKEQWFVEIIFTPNGSNEWNYKITTIVNPSIKPIGTLYYSTDGDYSRDLSRQNVYDFSSKIALSIISGNGNGSYGFPALYNIQTDNNYQYSNAVVKKDDKFYKYVRREDKDVKTYGLTNKVEFVRLCEDIGGSFWTTKGDDNYIEQNISFDMFSNIKYTNVTYSYKELSAKDSGALSIDLTSNFIDEPYIILCVPLFDVSITDTNGVTYNIEKQSAFNVFNSVIEYLSGESPYLVDAQIYPYAPDLISVSSELVGIPFFSINSANYTRVSSINLLPNIDIKKEYIERVYSIIAPDQSAKFSFNFYDYKNKIIEGSEKGVNFAEMSFYIRTALKPFSIITSCVPIPDDGAIAGITYLSDLRGCKASGGGFQASLASNAFETYRRQNSNYQEIFNVQKDELILSQSVEKQNEQVTKYAGMISAGTFGAIAGAQLGDVSHLAKGDAAIGAGVGLTAALGVTGVAYSKQQEVNEELRAFERNAQQQIFDLNIGTIKNLPLSVNRISTFNEIILNDFYYVVELYECTDEEKLIVDNFISKYGYSIGVFDYIYNYKKDGWFIKSSIVSSSYPPNLFNIAKNDLMGGIYIYD